MKVFFLKQVKFEAWANGRLLEILKSLGDSAPKESMLLLSHILNSQNMWYSRVTGAPINTTLFQERNLEDCAILLEKNTKSWDNYLHTCIDEDFKRIIEFIFPLDGSKKRISLEDALTHITTHASYHRGQIIKQLKGKVEPLPLLAYLIYTTEVHEA
jgi:uncharacterized damage-inducible protein DinB